MPNCDFTDYNPEAGRRHRAWVDHYMAKGCGKWKAEHCAYRKTKTWPPK